MSNKLKIWLDDERKPEEWDHPGWTWVKTATECIELLKKGNVEAISFDHDLGEINGKQEKTGYSVIMWIEEEVFKNPDYLPPKEMEPHSSNYTGYEKIKVAIEHVEKMMVERWGDDWRDSKGLGYPRERAQNRF